MIPKPSKPKEPKITETKELEKPKKELSIEEEYEQTQASIFDEDDEILEINFD